MNNEISVFLDRFIPSMDRETIKANAGGSSDANPGGLEGSWSQFCGQSAIADFVGAEVGAGIWVNRFSGW